MRRTARARAATALRTAAHLRLGARRHGTVLVLAHMRSGSSLLAHLLCAQESVVGWGERNRPLGDRHDLARLAADIALRHRNPRLALPPPMGPRWTLDVLNHDALLPRPGLLERRDLRLVFLLREPRGCLTSMSRYLGRHYGWTAARCVTAYVGRLAHLARIAEGLGDEARSRSVALAYEEILADPAAALRPVMGLLGSANPPRLRYPTQPWTGVFGDRSPPIHAGHVLSDRQRLGEGTPPADDAAVAATLGLTEATVERARRAFTDCHSALSALRY